MKAETF